MKFTSVEDAKAYLAACHHMRDSLLNEELELSNRIEEVSKKIFEAQMWLRSNKEDK